MGNVPHHGSTAILVLGMHRSGTSVSTRVVNMLGADLGTNFLPPAADNPVGFWEHLGAHEIHERLLAALGRSWSDISEMPDGWTELPAAQVAVDELMELCRTEFAGSSLWAVKDPRMCRLVPLWLMALERLGVRAVAMFVARDPLEVAASLKARDGWRQGESHLMWIQHLLEAEQYTRGIPRTMVGYDLLMADWRGAMERVEKDLGIAWPGEVSGVASNIDGFIDPGHRHHRAAESTDVAPAFGSVFVEALYGACLSVQAGTAGWDVFTQFEEEYARAIDLFGLPISDCEQVVKKLRGDVHIWEADSRAARGLLGDKTSELDVAKGLIESQAASLSSLRTFSEEQASLLEAVTREKAVLGDRLDATEAARVLVSSELSTLQANASSRWWLLRKFIGR
jgi:hypothetical protein